MSHTERTAGAAAVASPPVVRWPALTEAGVDAVVTTRHGGVSTGPYRSLNLGLHVGDDPAAVIENRSRAATAVGLSLDDLVFARQAHGRHVAVVGTGDRGRGSRSDADAVAEADALVTTDAGVGLVVMVADCVPLVLADPEAGVLACVHAGWRGTVAGVTAAAVDRMADLGAVRSRIVAGLGPAIPPERYQVGEDVAEAVAESFGPATADLLRPDGWGRWSFDVRAANLVLLERSGVRPSQVSVIDAGTGDGDFFSDRAERPCGRFAAIARLRS